MAIPVATPNCLRCVNLLEGNDILVCQVYGEKIYFPGEAALDCPCYEEEPE